MADPLSLAASILTVATVAAQITSTLSKLRAVCELPVRLHTINNEVADLEVVLRQVNLVIVERQTVPSLKQQDILKHVVERADRKLLELQSLVRRLIHSCVGRNKFFSQAKAWLSEKPRLDVLQGELRNVKTDLNLILSAVQSQDLLRVKLDIESISLVTADLSQKQTIFRDNINQALQSNQHQVDQRLHALEQLLLQQAHMLRSNLNAEMGPGFLSRSASWPKPPTDPSTGIMAVAKTTQRLSNAGGVTVRAAQYPRLSCLSRCACACHTRREIRSPGLLQPIVGYLFVGYSGLPGTRKSCDNSECQRYQAPAFTIEYWFPLWFLSQIIQVALAVSPSSGPQLQLRTLRRVPDSSQCISFALGGNTEGLRGLFIQGLASPHDVCQSRNFSLLRWAVFAKQYETCKFLLEAGADHDQEGSSDRLWDFTLRGTLTDEEQDSVRGLLVRSDYVEDRNFAVIHKIVLKLHGRTLEQELLDHPLAVLQTDVEGRTALFWAAARGDERSTMTLLARGSDPNKMDANGVTPLYLAANEGRTGCIRLLLAAGAKADPKAPKGTPSRSTPLLCACMFATDPLAIKTLLDFGADPNASNPDGETPLIAVARCSSAPHALLLLKQGVNLNACTKNGRTALTMAIAHNNHQVLQVLLDQWHKYDTCPRLAGPNLLGIAAEYADAVTLGILATADHFKIRGGDIRYVHSAAAAASECLRARFGLSAELTAAFEELLSVMGQAPTEQNKEIREKNTELLMESGLLRRDTDSSSDLEYGDALECQETDPSKKLLIDLS